MEGGAHTQRALSYYSFLRVPVKHDIALALVYAAALGAWLFPVAKGVFSLLTWEPKTISLAALAVAVFGFVSLYRALVAADNPRAATGLTKGPQGAEDIVGSESWQQGAIDHALQKMRQKVDKSRPASRMLKPLPNQNKIERSWSNI